MPDLLRLTDADTRPHDRRIAGRVSAGGPLQALRANGRSGLPWILRLELKDASRTGLGVLTDAPIEPGARLSLRVDPVHGSWCSGEVVRCEPEGEHYRIGIRYLARVAA